MSFLPYSSSCVLLFDPHAQSGCGAGPHYLAANAHHQDVKVQAVHYELIASAGRLMKHDVEWRACVSQQGHFHSCHRQTVHSEEKHLAVKNSQQLLSRRYLRRPGLLRCGRESNMLWYIRTPIYCYSVLPKLWPLTQGNVKHCVAVYWKGWGMMKTNNYLAVWCDSCHRPAPGYQQTHSNKGAGKVLRQVTNFSAFVLWRRNKWASFNISRFPQHQQSLQPLGGIQGSRLQPGLRQLGRVCRNSSELQRRDTPLTSDICHGELEAVGGKNNMYSTKVWIHSSNVK